MAKVDEASERRRIVERIAVYARVSTNQQEAEKTVDAQLYDCQRHAEQQGWEVVEEFVDEGVSGSVPLEEREAGARLLAAAEEGAFDRVLTHRLDRLSRDTLGCLLAVRKLKTLRTPVEHVEQRFDDSPAGEFQRTVMAAVAELEKSTIRDRMMTGHRRRAREGAYFAVWAPYGYRRHQCPRDSDGCPQRGTLEVDPLTGPVVEEMFAWAREGASCGEIMRRLNARGQPPPSQPHNPSERGWYRSTVARLLREERYTGRRTYGRDGKTVEMTCPPLVTEEVFEEVRAAVGRNKLNSRRSTKRSYLLQHVVRCGTCQGRYDVHTELRRNGTERVVYTCRRRRVFGPREGHENVRWRWVGDDLEGLVADWVRAVLMDPEAALKMAEVHLDRATQERWRVEREQEGLRRRLAELAQQEKRVLKSWRKVGLTDEEFTEAREEIAAERREIEAALARPVEPDPKADKAALFVELARTVPDMLGFKDGFAGIVGAQPNGEVTIRVDETGTCKMTHIWLESQEMRDHWRKLIEALVDEVIIHDDGRVEVKGSLVPVEHSLR